MKSIAYVLVFLLLCACDDIVGIEDISDNAVSIIAPTEGVVLSTTNINLSWDAMLGAEQYKLQIVTPSFMEADQVVLDTLTTSNNFNISLELGDYEWRIRGENSAYQSSYITQSFSIE